MRTLPFQLRLKTLASLSRQNSCRFHPVRLVTRPGHTTYSTSSGITLRPYQEESIQAVVDNLRRGERRLGISLATGAGKTVIFSQLIGRIHPPNADATRTLILVHRRELVEQAARHCIGAYPDKSVEIDMGKMKASGNADITVASVMSLTRNGRLDKYKPSQFKLVLVDEAHHIVASAYLQILRHFGLLREKEADGSLPTALEAPASGGLQAHNPFPALVGVSATFSRFDGLSLGHAIDRIVYHKDYIDLIGEKWLSDVVFSTVRSQANLSKVKSKTGGDFLSSSLSAAVNTNANNDAAVQAWLEKAHGNRTSTLGFCVDVAHVEGLTETFRRHGIDARFVTGSTPSATRSQMVDAFRRNEFPVLLNVGVFTEGTDIPNIDCILLTRPTKSRNLLVQMVGRGMRLSAGKQNCHVIDMVSALTTGIVTVPTLFGLDPTVLLQEASIKEIERQKADPSAVQHLDGTLAEYAKEDQGAVDLSYKFYASVADLISDGSDNAHVRKTSSNAWIHVGRDSSGVDRHILSGADKSYLTIRDLGEDSGPRPRYQVTETRKIPTEARGVGSVRGDKKWQPNARPRTIAKAKSFADAVHAADTFAGKAPNFPRMLIDRHQDWRSRPPTRGQVEMLTKMMPEDSEVDLESLDNGTCAVMITKLKFGAKGQFGAIQSAQGKVRRARRKAEIVEEMREREKVRVGPLSSAG